MTGSHAGPDTAAISNDTGMDMERIIRVWDPLLRVFHWTLVLAFFTAYLSGDEENTLHIWSGYLVGGLLGFRLLWGLIGGRHARFTDFVTGPRKVLHYLSSLLRGRPAHYIGHNPAGGWMVILMLATLAVVTVSGLKVYAIEEGLGPLAMDVPDLQILAVAHADDDDEDDDDEHEHEHDEDEEEFWEEIHEASANFMLLLIALHVTGVLVSSVLHRENLVRAMVTGKKTRAP